MVAPSVSRGIAKAALIIMLGNVASRLLGVAREEAIAALFGLTDAADAFSVAARVTTPVYDLIIGGIISAALIPVFTDYADREDRRALWRLGSIVLNVVAIVFVVLAAVLVVLAPQLVGLFGYGYAAEKQAIAVELLRVMLVALVLMGAAGVMTALLYSQRRFVYSAFIGSVYNLGILVMALAFHQRWGVNALVVGVLLGAALQVMIQLPALRTMRYSLALDLREPGVRRILGLYLPVFLGLLVSAVGVTVDTGLVSRTGGGNLAAMRYATTMIQFPLGLVATAVGFAVLPTLSRQASRVTAWQPQATHEAGRADLESAAMGSSPGFAGSGLDVGPGGASAGPPLADSHEALAEYRATLALGLKMVLLAVIPATLGLVVFRSQAVRLVFQHGIFGADDAARTAIAVLAYAPGLPAAAIDQVLIFSFYARKNTIVPVTVGVAAVLVYLASALALVGPLGMPGLALANSAQWVAHATVMFILIWRAVGSLRGLGLGVLAFKVTAAAAVMAGALLALSRALPWDAATTGTATLGLFLALAVAVGVAVYGLMLLLLRVRETQTALAMVRERLSASGG